MLLVVYIRAQDFSEWQCLHSIYRYCLHFAAKRNIKYKEQVFQGGYRGKKLNFLCLLNLDLILWSGGIIASPLLKRGTSDQQTSTCGPSSHCILLPACWIAALLGDGPRGPHLNFWGENKNQKTANWAAFLWPLFPSPFFIFFKLWSFGKSMGPWEEGKRTILLPTVPGADVCPFRTVSLRLIRPFGFSYIFFPPKRAELYEKVEASCVTLQQAQGQAKPITDNCIARVWQHRGDLRIGCPTIIWGMKQTGHAGFKV